MRGLGMVDPSRVVAVGWGFGGAGAIQLLRAWPNSDGLLGARPLRSSCSVGPLPPGLKPGIASAPSDTAYGSTACI